MSSINPAASVNRVKELTLFGGQVLMAAQVVKRGWLQWNGWRGVQAEVTASLKWKQAGGRVELAPVRAREDDTAEYVLSLTGTVDTVVTLAWVTRKNGFDEPADGKVEQVNCQAVVGPHPDRQGEWRVLRGFVNFHFSGYPEDKRVLQDSVDRLWPTFEGKDINGMAFAAEGVYARGKLPDALLPNGVDLNSQGEIETYLRLPTGPDGIVKRNDELQRRYPEIFNLDDRRAAIEGWAISVDDIDRAKLKVGGWHGHERRWSWMDKTFGEGNDITTPSQIVEAVSTRLKEASSDNSLAVRSRLIDNIFYQPSRLPEWSIFSWDRGLLEGTITPRKTYYQDGGYRGLEVIGGLSGVRLVIGTSRSGEAIFEPDTIVVALRYHQTSNTFWRSRLSLDSRPLQNPEQAMSPEWKHSKLKTSVMRLYDGDVENISGLSIRHEADLLELDVPGVPVNEAGLEENSEPTASQIVTKRRWLNTESGWLAIDGKSKNPTINREATGKGPLVGALDLTALQQETAHSRAGQQFRGRLVAAAGETARVALSIDDGFAYFDQQRIEFKLDLHFRFGDRTVVCRSDLEKIRRVFDGSRHQIALVAFDVLTLLSSPPVWFRENDARDTGTPAGFAVARKTPPSVTARPLPGETGVSGNIALQVPMSKRNCWNLSLKGSSYHLSTRGSGIIGWTRAILAKATCLYTG